MKFERPTCKVEVVEGAAVGDFNPADILVVVAAGVVAVVIIAT